MMSKVLFVCLGNICRSPMAEAIFNELIVGAGLDNLLECDSCGTSSNHIGEAPDKRTIKILSQNSIDTNHKARQFHVSDFDQFDHIIAMDENNLNDIMKLYNNKYLGNAQPLIELMRNYDPSPDSNSVPDPWWGDMRDFEFCYQLLYTCCSELIKKYQK